MSSPTTPLIILILSSIITPVLAHDNGHDAATMSDGGSQLEALPPSYVDLADHAAAMYVHITLMVIAWVLVLPLAVMLSLARSRYTLASQSVFLAINALGVLVGTIYNAATPDLYPNNAHHKAGWAFTWVALAQLPTMVSIDIGFAVITGLEILFAVYGRLFEGRAIYGGMAHWVKGGVFFWLGIFTLGRWSGSFGELCWAWNARTRGTQDKWCPSAELVESALIFSYGATNIFLEHLSSTDKTWTPRDLEHVSITILFIGGGLLGMLVESTRARDLLNTTGTEVASPAHEATRTDGERTEKQNAAEPPKHYDFSINPIPALVILLLGTTMSSHHQSTMDSTMMHKQWGNLLAGASLARGFTYVLVYLKPPRSILPSRPPTELVTSFCLITGGIIFMASSTDTVEGLRHYNLDAIFVYTVATGIVGLLMAWVIIVLAVKGAAVRQQRRAQTSTWTSNERHGV
ncbi:putative membrane protein C3B8.06 like [Verticillium longisporum]|nr:putative membrane protein C3B8.06 like [Verticillium longisporum]